METAELKKLCDQVISISEEVGEFIFLERQNFDKARIELKGSKNNLVSYVDKQAELKIVEKLGELIPEAGFIAEEGTGEAVEGGYNWIIDPLDGTTNFIHNIPFYSVSIALMKGDELLLGVIRAICQNETYHAVKGGGAFCNGKAISVSDNSNLDESLVITGMPYDSGDKHSLLANFEMIEALMKESHGFRRFGSAAIDIAMVASGKADAFYEYGLNAWDLAGGAVILTEAGGIVTDFKGGNDFVFGRQVIASSSNFYPTLAALVKKAFLD
ncbi:inositol monophosphatase family protein [Flammeovirgaceae bacterium SG7u.111]|nr:inositol monophosphatase family protein [Flammeovirgaceae bacterium SG7u.132]WPO35709.1 inositol monophosphatase family protein [Flammeovirgaceae bacterium SG7u.111]